MLDTLSLDDASGAAVVLHETAARVVNGADGLVGIPAPRDVVRPRPQAHGVIDDSSFLDARIISIDGEVWGSSIQAAEDELDLLTGPAYESLVNDGALLKWQRAGAGLALQSEVKLAGEFSAPLAGGAALIPYHVQFRAEDPRAYSQTLTTAVGSSLVVAAGGHVYPYTYPRRYNPSGGGGASCVNVGKVPTPPVIRVYGFCSAPRVRLVETGQEVVLTGQIANGDFIQIDMATRAVTLNGVTSRQNLIDYTQSSFFELPKGASNVQLLSAVFDATARVDVLYRAAYL